MSKRAWILVAVLLGGGVLLQIPQHGPDEMDHASMAGTETSTETGSSAVSATALEIAAVRTVRLEVTGMT